MSGLVHEKSVGKTVEWYTPPEIFKALKLEFDLDPCSPGKDVIPWNPAKKHYTATDDGLNQPWYGRVWLNPPYGSLTRVWLDLLAEHNDGIALVFNRSDTEWFQRYAQMATAICFIAGRVRFVNSNGEIGDSPGCGSILIAYGAECAEAVKRSRLGFCVDIDGKYKSELTLFEG